MPKRINKGFSGVILESQEGKLLFQLRDNKPGIPHPGQWSLFGGGIESRETPKQAIMREVGEELGIKIDKNNLIFLTKIGFGKNKGFIFYYKLQDRKKHFNLNEGQQYGFFRLREILFKRKVVPSLRMLLVIYPILKLIS